MDTPNGFAFPFQIDPVSGRVAQSSGSHKIHDNLLLLLQTELGERVLRRQYGAGLRGLLHEPLGSAFFALIKSQILRAIVEHEPRIELVDLVVAPGAGAGEVEVDLLYVVRATRVPERLGLQLGPFGSVVSDAGAMP